MIIAHGDSSFHGDAIDLEPLPLLLALGVAAFPFGCTGGAVRGP